MDGTANILLIVVLGAVLAVLVVGVAAMLKGGEFNRKYGNKLMRMRVLLQGAALLVLALLFFAG
ncbi:MAG: twin transmembrane helix small protein [Alphaproteobacteria bacterium]|nr:twin transmembrane helix small protein [Alphaproteobacteria bacterium]